VALLVCNGFPVRPALDMYNHMHAFFFFTVCSMHREEHLAIILGKETCVHRDIVYSMVAPMSM
jgi:hypothetical protein